MIVKFSAGGHTFRYEGKSITDYKVKLKDSIPAPLPNGFSQFNSSAFVTGDDGSVLCSPDEDVTVLEIVDPEKMTGFVVTTNACVYIMENGKTIDTIHPF